MILSKYKKLIQTVTCQNARGRSAAMCCSYSYLFIHSCWQTTWTRLDFRLFSNFFIEMMFSILVLCEPARLVWVLKTHFLSFFIHCCCLTSRTWLPFGCFELLIGVYRCSCAVFSPDLTHALGWALQLISLSLFIHCLDQDTKSNKRIHCVKILSVCYCREQLLTFNVDEPEKVEL